MTSKHINWERPDDAASLSDRVIDGAELLLGITFPDDYRDCVRSFHGCHPDATDFRADNNGQVWHGSVGVLLTLDPFTPCNVFDVLSSLAVDQQLPSSLIPVAEDGGGNYLCLDYRHSSTPSVAFWFHEVGGDDGAVFVCDSFSQLLDRLYVPDDVIADHG